ncbi:hypothetical protein M422DRAFT_242536 [Sphaerobolus stellatus SS14]|nr:hypothetical protein M422DRAFT_242536 [Sphaerobolus stellatus SS14]
MLEAADDEELQAKLRKLCDEQDTFRTQTKKKMVENNKKTGASKKAGTNMKASGSTPKTVNLRHAMQTHISQVNYCLKEVERQVEDWAAMNEEGEPVNKEVFDQTLEESSGLELEDKDEEVEEVCEEIEGPRKEDKESREVEDKETMKDPEVDEL